MPVVAVTILKELRKMKPKYAKRYVDERDGSQRFCHINKSRY